MANDDNSQAMASVDTGLVRSIVYAGATPCQSKISRMSFRLDTLKTIVQTAFENYKDGVRISTLLDDKAQKTGAFAGLFIAAALGFLKPSDVQSMVQSIGLSGTIFLTFQVILLVICLSLCLSVMWVRGVPPPLNLFTHIKLTEDLLTLPDGDITDAHQSGVLYDQIEIWKEILKQQSQVNRSKAFRLFAAQLSLAGSVAAIAVLLILLAIKTYNDIPKI